MEGANANVPMQRQSMKRSECFDELLGISSPERKKTSRRKFLFNTSQEGYSPSSRDCEVELTKRMLRRTIGGLIPRTQKNFPKEVFFFTSQEGYSPCSRDCEVELPKRMLRRTVGVLIPRTQKKLPEGSFLFTSQEGFEPPTDALEGRCSIQLSY